MIVLSDVAGVRGWTASQRAAGRRIGLVPTMGFLHEGHLALVDQARRGADAVVLTIFVNPLQFATGEDLDRYPRDLARDQSLAAARGVDLLFVPETATMYPPGTETRVVPGEAADRWEGASRPGHFTGVLTVVAKLFNLLRPDVAVFGQKDIQQVTLVRAMVRDLDWPLDLVVVPTVREPDGLALSSRNGYLTPRERTQALGLHTALSAAADTWRSGERAAGQIERVVRSALGRFPGVGLDYIACVEPRQLRPVDVAAPGTVLAIAARVGTTRLIDNVILGQESA